MSSVDLVPTKVSKRVRVNLCFAPGFYRSLGIHAKELGVSRSRLIEHAVNFWLQFYEMEGKHE